MNKRTSTKKINKQHKVKKNDGNFTKLPELVQGEECRTCFFRGTDAHEDLVRVYGANYTSYYRRKFDDVIQFVDLANPAWLLVDVLALRLFNVTPQELVKQVDSMAEEMKGTINVDLFEEAAIVTLVNHLSACYGGDIFELHRDMLRRIAARRGGIKVLDTYQRSINATITSRPAAFTEADKRPEALEKVQAQFAVQLMFCLQPQIAVVKTLYGLIQNGSLKTKEPLSNMMAALRDLLCCKNHHNAIIDLYYFAIRSKRSDKVLRMANVKKPVTNNVNAPIYLIDSTILYKFGESFNSPYKHAGYVLHGNRVVPTLADVPRYVPEQGGIVQLQQGRYVLQPFYTFLRHMEVADVSTQYVTLDTDELLDVVNNPMARLKTALMEVRFPQSQNVNQQLQNPKSLRQIIHDKLQRIGVSDIPQNYREVHCYHYPYKVHFMYLSNKLLDYDVYDRPIRASRTYPIHRLGHHKDKEIVFLSYDMADCILYLRDAFFYASKKIYTGEMMLLRYDNDSLVLYQRSDGGVIRKELSIAALGRSSAYVDTGGNDYAFWFCEPLYTETGHEHVMVLLGRVIDHINGFDIRNDIHKFGIYERLAMQFMVMLNNIDSIFA